MQIPVSYSKGMSRKYPEHVVIAIVPERSGKYNPITLEWTMTTSHDPPMMAISVGLPRYSLGLIREARQFVIAFPSAEMASDALFYGTHSGRDMDKIDYFGTETQPALKIDGVLFCGAVANFECSLESELETGDHVIFVGRVLASHINQNSEMRRLYTLDKNLTLGPVQSLFP
ncbi:MAG TPA: flavin reductase family protein [Spirochaetia bacterium]|nr:flavin reductase family protein [Spirochaetia bacterium]